ASAGWARAAAGGALIGFTSALLGVGGGLVAIPVLIYWLRTPLRRVSATSLAIVAVTATVGALSYAISGW
ncbi:MAG: TSUP family transporter, partial [Gemmatimonadetes bacterium]|nr:TSUP family transporter [Gemmatimonadota bacterium]NIQ59736.1 TSUP family transporter [Gemmatimonadota bacterium]NIU79933.1 TSUP family transporter [Gammaproteobacteria bacterium]NIX25424.1 TSUP family transporter [Actinomycetota bacterium]NIX48405.1 TSUP family transporter [Gemmatimonadota bacterium]